MSLASSSNILVLPNKIADDFDLLDFADTIRLRAARQLEKERQVALGQYFTPAPVAERLAKLLRVQAREERLLDAGAGVGMLSAAFVADRCKRADPPRKLSVTAYELDASLHDDLRLTLEACSRLCRASGLAFDYTIIGADFIEEAARALRRPLFHGSPAYTAAILNPPYRKIGSASKERELLRSVGIETANLYTGFLALAARLLEPQGQLAAITPRSFCNGPYFKAFREDFLAQMVLTDLQVFASRGGNFDEVLQENLILRAEKSQVPPKAVSILSLESIDDPMPSEQRPPYEAVVNPSDPERFIHIATDGLAQQISVVMSRFSHSLEDLGLEVSTGKVVDFRVREALRAVPEERSVPLLYPHNLAEGSVRWPISKGKKPQAIARTEKTERQLLPPGCYVLVKRFSAKEEPRRVVAALCDSEEIGAPALGIENHLNYFHIGGGGLPKALARGLTLFLNTSLFDEYFRQFNGHTQVNATDLRNLRYPSREELLALADAIPGGLADQDEVDKIVERAFMQDDAFTPSMIKAKIEEAMQVLASLGLPRQQLNERSALTLLALLGLTPATPWAEAKAPLMGITPIMDFMAEHYGKRYKPNTRETVRRQTMHQFVDAGIALYNPDEPNRPPNSPKAVYQIEPAALKLLRTFGTEAWDEDLQTYLDSVETLKERYAQKRSMERIPVTFNENIELTLSPGGQNVLVEKIISEFCPRFAPGGRVIYLGDTEEKMLYFDEQRLEELGVVIEEHGKMPDVIVHYTDKNWLLLIEAVTSHGPVNPKRLGELAAMFRNSKAGLVYVTTFLTRKAMLEYIDEIAWETEVWVAESPGHMIHFNGERFLGPYE